MESIFSWLHNAYMKEESYDSKNGKLEWWQSRDCLFLLYVVVKTTYFIQQNSLLESSSYCHLNLNMNVSLTKSFVLQNSLFWDVNCSRTCAMRGCLTSFHPCRCGRTPGVGARSPGSSAAPLPRAWARQTPSEKSRRWLSRPRRLWQRWVALWLLKTRVRVQK